jgi:hypothetical protein
MGHYSSGKGGSIDHNVDPPAEQLLLVGQDVITSKIGGAVIQDLGLVIQPPLLDSAG